MTVMEIGNTLVALCREGNNQEAIDRLYDPAIESVEPQGMPGMDQVQRGLAAIKGKNRWWTDNHTIHHATVEGPYTNGSRFTVRFQYDVTAKQTGTRMTMEEIGLYTVNNGKIAKEEFFYSMG